MINEIVAHGIRLFFSFGIRSSAPLLAVTLLSCRLVEPSRDKENCTEWRHRFSKVATCKFARRIPHADTNFYNIVEASTPKFGEWAERWDSHEPRTGAIYMS